MTSNERGGSFAQVCVHLRTLQAGLAKKTPETPMLDSYCCESNLTNLEAPYQSANGGLYAASRALRAYMTFAKEYH